MLRGGLAVVAFRKAGFLQQEGGFICEGLSALSEPNYEGVCWGGRHGSSPSWRWQVPFKVSALFPALSEHPELSKVGGTTAWAPEAGVPAE